MDDPFSWTDAATWRPPVVERPRESERVREPLQGEPMEIPEWPGPTD